MSRNFVAGARPTALASPAAHPPANGEAGLPRKERLILEALKARGDNFVGEAELCSLAFGIFDDSPDRARVANHIRNIRESCAQSVGGDAIERHPQKGYRMTRGGPRRDDRL